MSSSERGRDCGCETGAAFAAVALLAWPFVWLALCGVPASVPGGVRALLAWASAVLGAAITGKVIGIGLARRRRARDPARRAHASTRV